MVRKRGQHRLLLAVLVVDALLVGLGRRGRPQSGRAASSPTVSSPRETSSPAGPRDGRPATSSAAMSDSRPCSWPTHPFVAGGTALMWLVDVLAAVVADGTFSETFSLHQNHLRKLLVLSVNPGKRVRIQWAGADVEPEPEVLAHSVARAASGRVRICLGPLPRNRHSSLSLLVLRCGKSGPAQIRTAVTATRRPKDTKLPHRPAVAFG